MREDELAHAGFFRHLTALSGMEMRGARTIGRKRAIEHGQIGMSYGAGDYAHDIRLACHGLDAGDNDFVVGLVGKELYPLSHVVQTMRKTQQTSLYLTNLGPFWVGRAVWQSAV